jgi:uridine phosphorylase
MFNHNRGLWGYTGAAPDGEPLTIQSTGMGGPSAAIVIAELADLGAGTLLRVGTCGGLSDSLALGELLIAGEAVVDDGTSRALGAGERVSGSPELLARLQRGAEGQARTCAVVSTDLFYDGPPDAEQGWIEQGALAVEMETAALFALAARRGLQAGSLLIVSDLLLPVRRRIDRDVLTTAERRLGELAARALAA